MSRADNVNPLETEYVAELVIDLISGRAVVHLSYRPRRGRRIWTRFYLVPDAGETFAEVAAKIGPAIAAHAAELSR